MAQRNHGGNMTDIQTLDFKDFPHIVKPSELEDRAELEKRSRAIQSIKDHIENVVKEMFAYVDDLQTFDSKIRMLNAREANIKADEADLRAKENVFYKQKDEVEEQKKYLVNATADLKVKESELADNKKILEEIEKAKEQYEIIKNMAIREQTNVISLKTKENELNERESLITKSEKVDAERKTLLDIREQRIKAKETRLQIEQNE
jgi:uncharacterized protein YyaL (SSP411 family)